VDETEGIYKAMIRKVEGGYVVLSESKDKEGHHKKLGGPYSTMAAAKKRLQQVEYFKHKGK
jgi:hypothetical protein